MSIHFMGAAAFSAPELALDDKEANQLAKAAQDVAKHYSVRVDPKTLAWINLSWVAGCIYGPRFMAIRLRMKQEAEKKKEDTPTPGENISPFPVRNNGDAPSQ